jgi:hypothetical protein
MKTLATLLSPLYLLTWLFTLSLLTPTHAADLTFTPATPLVEINKTITLAVQGAVGTVKWTTIEGTIQGDGLQVTYLAPAQAGLDAVTVLDSSGNFASVKVVITPPQTFSLENAQWEIFTNRSQVGALWLSVAMEGTEKWIKGWFKNRVVMQCGWCSRTASLQRTSSPDGTLSLRLHHY